MPESTLNKFGVPVTGGRRDGLLMPKLSYRFRVILDGFGLHEISDRSRVLTQQVISCTRPKVTHDEVVLHAYNSIAYVAGKHKWDEVTLKIRDDISNSIASHVGAQVQKQMNHMEQVSAVAGGNYKFSARIETLDGTNADELEVWFLEGCYLSGTSYPDGDYSSGNGAHEIELTIRYDNATNLSGVNTLGGNVLGPIFTDSPNYLNDNTVGAQF